MKKLMIVAIAVLVSTSIQAQNTREAIQNTKQILTGKKMLERDVKELADFSAKVTTFTRFYNARKTAEANRLKASLVKDMVREVRQSEAKAKKARREVNQSTREVISERKEISDNKKDSRRTTYDRRDDKRDMARDRANLRDDKRDRRDDVRDLKQQIVRAERQAKILKGLQSYNFAFGENDLLKARIYKKMITDFEETMKADVAATRIELQEDRREAKEDRRERRDDRNERNEKDANRKRWRN